MGEQFSTIVDDICENDMRYPQGAYAFVMESLSYTQKKYKASKHVSGEEILEGIKELLMKKFGPMTMTVLKYWGIKSTVDFGNIIFNLVDNEILSKTKEDDIEKFQDGYDFDDVFLKGYRKQLHKKISRMRSM